MFICRLRSYVGDGPRHICAHSTFSKVEHTKSHTHYNYIVISKAVSQVAEYCVLSRSYIYF